MPAVEIKGEREWALLTEQHSQGTSAYLIARGCYIVVADGIAIDLISVAPEKGCERYVGTAS